MSKSGLDVDEFIRWLTKAAVQGHGLACYSLGLIHFEWVYKSRNPVEAVMWFTLASQLLKRKKDQGKALSRFRKLTGELFGAQVMEGVEWACDFHKTPFFI